MIRISRILLAAVAATVALSVLVAPAFAAKGAVSVGSNFGVGIYSMSAVNDSLEAAGYEKMSDGYEFGGSLRYQMSQRAALDLEVTSVKPKSTTADTGGDIEFTAPAVAIPLSLVYMLSENDRYRFNFVVGAGILSGAKLRGKSGTTIDEKSKSKSSAFGQAGLETEWLVSPQFALTARALGRLSGKPTVEFLGSDIELDYTGVAFGLGARVSFGGGGQ